MFAYGEQDQWVGGVYADYIPREIIKGNKQDG